MLLLMLSAKGTERAHHVVLNDGQVSYPQSFCDLRTGTSAPGYQGIGNR